MKKNNIEEFIEKIKIESTYKKFLKEDIIQEIFNIFNGAYDRLSYPCKIKNTIELSLKFYEEYNKQYYNLIIDGIKNKRIIITTDKTKSFVSTKNNIAYIGLCGNDSDLFNIVHELAHYVDKNSNPPIVADSFWFLSETFSFYMEKKLEMWLDTKKYKNLILTRRNNRIYYEAKMLKAVRAELYYEEIFKKEGSIKETNIDIENIKLIRNYNVTNLVNYLLQYPLANIISDYLIKNNIPVVDKDFADICLSLDLYEILKIYSSNKKRK